MKTYIHLVVVLITSLAFAVDAAAQCGTLGEGELDPNNSCQLCRNSTLESLPDRTACSVDRQVQCDGERVFRHECNSGACVENERFEGVCPGGLVCDLTDMACLRSCLDATQCQDGYDCDNGVCRGKEVPCLSGTARSPVDGNCYEPCSDGACSADFVCTDDLCLPTSAPDMGQPPGDMGQPPGDMGQPPGDMGAESDMGQPNGGDDPEDKDGGSCAVSGGESSPIGTMLLLAWVVLGRRRK